MFLYTLNGIFKGLLKGLEQQIMGVCLQVIFRLIIAQLPNKRELSYFEGLLYFLFSLIVSQEWIVQIETLLQLELGFQWKNFSFQVST